MERGQKRRHGLYCTATQQTQQEWRLWSPPPSPTCLNCSEPYKKIGVLRPACCKFSAGQKVRNLDRFSLLRLSCFVCGPSFSGSATVTDAMSSEACFEMAAIHLFGPLHCASLPQDLHCSKAYEHGLFEYIHLWTLINKNLGNVNCYCPENQIVGIVSRQWSWFRASAN